MSLKEKKQKKQKKEKNEKKEKKGNKNKKTKKKEKEIPDSRREALKSADNGACLKNLASSIFTGNFSRLSTNQGSGELDIVQICTSLDHLSPPSPSSIQLLPTTTCAFGDWISRKFS